MKIGFVAQPFDVMPPRGGASIAIIIDELTKRLSEYGNDVTIYCRKASESQNVDLNNSVSYVRINTKFDDKLINLLKFTDRAIKKVIRKSFNFFFKYYFSSVYFMFYIILVSIKIKKNEEDVIVIYNFSQFINYIKF
jgi:hypothetical protein